MFPQRSSASTGFHIFLSPIKNESRLLKEAASSLKHGVVDQIVIVGIGEEFDTEYQQLGDHIFVWRMQLKTRQWPKNFVFQFLKYIEWTTRIVFYESCYQTVFVHAHSLAALPVGVLLKLMRSNPLVYDAHELETESTENKSVFWKNLSRFAERLFIRFADVVFVVSASIRDWYERTYKHQSVLLLTNAPYFTVVSKSDIYRLKYGIANTSVIYLYQGGLTPGRGIRTLLSVFSSLNDDRFHMVFMGYGPLQNEIVEASKQYATIHFHEAVSPEPKILLSHTSAADCGVFIFDKSVLSYNYSMPNKVFEYIMAGLPVIVTDGVELTKLVQQNDIGYTVKGENKESIMECIKNISLDQLREMTNRVASIRETYCWEKNEELLITTYKRIM